MASGLSISGESHDQVPRARKKAEPVKSACYSCRKRKTKCSGERPVCRSCSDRSIVCSWDITEGLTRNGDLRHKLQSANARLDDLVLLVETLRCGTDHVSTTLLAQLRLGASVEALAQSIRAEASGADPRDT